MIAYCVFEITYSTAALISESAIHSTSDGFVLYRHVNNLNRTVALFFLLSFCWFYFSLLAFLLVHFIYRYFVLCKTGLLWLFQGTKLGYWIIGCLLAGAFGVALKVNFLAENVETTERLRAEFEELYDVQMDDIVYNGPMLHICDKNDENCEHPTSTWVIAIILMIYIIAFCGSMIYLGSITYWQLSKYRAVRSDRMLRLQKQLWKALLIQTINPILFMYLPILSMYASAMCRISFGSYSNLSMIAFAVYPPLDQLLIIYIIKDFRKCVKKIFCGVVDRIRKQSNQNNNTNSTELEHL